MSENKQRERLIRDTVSQVRTAQGRVLFYGGLFSTIMLVCDFFKAPDDPNPYRKRAMQAAGVTLLALVYMEVKKDTLFPQGEGERQPPQQPPHR